MNRFLVTVLLLAATVGSVAAEQVLGFRTFTLTLPEGSTRSIQQGRCSQLVSIFIKDTPFAIHYDTLWLGAGPKRYEQIPKQVLHSAIYYERIDYPTLVGGIIAWVDVDHDDIKVTLEIYGVGAQFEIQLPRNASKAELRDAVAALRAIKATKVN